MGQVVILADGRPIKTDSNFSLLIFDIDGYLMEFTFVNKKYKYYTERDFKSRDLEIKGLNGYFDELQYLQYIQYVRGGAPTADELKYADKFNFDKFSALVNDTVNIKFVDFGEPYNYYYKEKSCSFTIEADPLTNKIKNYRDIVTNKILLPSNAVITPLNKDLNSNPRGLFYKKNFGDAVNSWLINDYKKEAFCRVVTLMAFRMFDINTQIFPNIINADSLLAIDGAANSDSTEGLTDLEKVIFTIKKSWGDFYIPGSPFLNRQDFDAILSNTPDYEEYENYLNSLKNFYFSVYKRQNIIAAAPPQKQLEILLEILPSSGLSLVHIDFRLKMLTNLSKDALDEEGEVLVLKILNSIQDNEKEAVLDFFLKKEDGIHTYFEIFYDTMDDERLKRYPFISWFADEEPNRMHFINLLHKIWENSKYDFQLGNGEFNNECYFMNEGSIYTKHPDGRPKDTILEFGQTNVDTFIEATDLLRIEKTSTNYKCKKGFIQELVTIEKFVDYSNSYTNKSGSYLGPAESLDSQQKTEISYHLYQPLSLLGYKENESIVVPNGRPVPAFLLYYTGDFKRLKKIDAAFSAGIEIGIEVVLFFTFVGGASALRHLRHLKHITKIHKALQGSLAAEETVLVWRGLETTSEVVSVSASVMMSLNTYNMTNLPEGPEKERRKKLNRIFLYITLSFAGIAALSRAKAVKAADEILDEIATLPPGAFPDDIKEVLIALKGEKTVALALFEVQMSSYSNIISKFGTYSPELKQAFWTDFRLKIDDTAFWLKLNSSAENMDNWRDLYLLGASDRRILEFVTNPKRVIAIKRFYNEDELYKILEPIHYDLRVKFLDEFGDIEIGIFNKIANEPKRLDLIISFLNTRITGANIFDKADILRILSSNLDKIKIELLSLKLKKPLSELHGLFISNITKIEMPLNRLENLFKGEWFETITLGFSNGRKRAFQGSNKLLTEVNVFLDDVPIGGEPIRQNFISGRKETVNYIFGQTLPENFKDIDDYLDYDNFNIKAIDINNVDRINDTELKFVYNFLTEHWNKGNRFDITLESTIDVCTSCQAYLMYLEDLGKQYNKIINFTIKSNSGITTTAQIINTLN